MASNMAEQLMSYALLGLGIGVLSGMFGVGGSSISTPVLRIFLGVPPLIALATPLPLAIPTAIAGAYTYYRRGLVDKEIVLWCTVSGVPSVILGALATAIIAGFWLMILTGFILIGLGIRIAWSAFASPEATYTPPRAAIRRKSKILLLAMGLFAGFFSGLLANGGGFLLVPAFILILGLTMHEAAGMSLICVAGFAIPGSLVHWALGHIDPVLMLSLGITIVPASYLGARLALRLKSSHVQLFFGIFLVVFALGFLYSEISQAVLNPMA